MHQPLPLLDSPHHFPLQWWGALEKKSNRKHQITTMRVPLTCWQTCKSKSPCFPNVNVTCFFKKRELKASWLEENLFSFNLYQPLGTSVCTTCILQSFSLKQEKLLSNYISIDPEKRFVLRGASKSISSIITAVAEMTFGASEIIGSELRFLRICPWISS